MGPDRGRGVADGHVTDDLRFGTVGFMVERVPVLLGVYFFGPENINARRQWRTGSVVLECFRGLLSAFGAWVLADTPGGHETLRDLVDPRLRDIVDHLVLHRIGRSGPWRDRRVRARWQPPPDGCHRDSGPRYDGRLAERLDHEAAPRDGDTRDARQRDPAHLQRMQSVAKAGRRPAAILFADLEASSPHAALSTANYFSFGQPMTRAATSASSTPAASPVVTSATGSSRSSSPRTSARNRPRPARARGCRALRAAITEVASRSDLAPDDLTMRFGLHWGATLYVGQSRPADAPRSPRSATRSTKGRASKPAPRRAHTRLQELIERLAPTLPSPSA